MWTVRALAAACTVAAFAVAACSGTESYGSLPPVGPSSESSPPRASSPGPGARAADRASAAEAAVVTQYLRFWTRALPAAAAAPAERRRGILAPVTAEPELTHLVRSMAALDADGQRNYGADVPVGQTVRVSGDLALVAGCLDSRRSGVADAATGTPLTRGVARNPVRADLTRGPDGQWRVSAVTYPPGTPC